MDLSRNLNVCDSELTVLIFTFCWHHFWIIQYLFMPQNAIDNNLQMQVLKSSFLEVFPSFFISLEYLILALFDSEIFTFKWLLMCCIAVAVLALKTNPFLQSYLPTSVSPDGLQFKNAFCNYNIWHICELPNSYFSFSPCIKIKCCLLNCKSFNLWPLHLCFG